MATDKRSGYRRPGIGTGVAAAAAGDDHRCRAAVVRGDRRSAPPADAERGAIGYWESAKILLGEPSSYPVVVLRLRGVLTSLVYAPAALCDLLVDGSGPLVVLIQNSLIIAVLGAVLLPSFARAVGARGMTTVWVCAALVWLVAAPFAPYPLMDLPAAALFAAVVLAASRRSPWLLAAAGLGPARCSTSGRPTWCRWWRFLS